MPTKIYIYHPYFLSEMSMWTRVQSLYNILVQVIVISMFNPYNGFVGTRAFDVDVAVDL